MYNGCRIGTAVKDSALIQLACISKMGCTSTAGYILTTFKQLKTIGEREIAISDKV